MMISVLLAATLLCEGNIQTNKGTKQHVNIMLMNMTDEKIEMGLPYGRISLVADEEFGYSAPLDEYGSVVEIKFSKRSGNVHYTYLNFGSDKDLKNAASGWLSCRKL